MDLSQNWKNYTYVAFDTETTGAYPLHSEICEIAAVKWVNGQIVDEYQTLVQPSHPMTDFIIGIHGISNEMVKDAPKMSAVIGEFYKFIQEAVLVAHHAPFDLGFVAVELEKANLALPTQPILCSSLLSRKVFPRSPDHKLQTLIRYLELPQGQAHRALDDAKACLQVTLKSMEKLGDVTLVRLLEKQGKDLHWSNYSIKILEEDSVYSSLIYAIRQKKGVYIVYEGGSQKGKERIIRPIGIVRNPDGDYVMAFCETSQRDKRFYLNKISFVRPMEG